MLNYSVAELRIAYIIVGIVAVLIFALIVSLAFPTRYYVVRRW